MWDLVHMQLVFWGYVLVNLPGSVRRMAIVAVVSGRKQLFEINLREADQACLA